MIRTFAIATALCAVLAVSAVAADTTTTTDTGTASAAAAQTVPAGMMLTEQEAKSWVGQPVYSSDGNNLGRVVDIQRSSDNTVTGMHADIGGLLGFLQTRINLATSQFKLQGDRVLLTLTAAEAKELPAVK
jgi:PRC-barrel domain